MKNQLHRIILHPLVLALLAVSCLTGAALLPDPTRPPEYSPSGEKSIEATGPLQLTAVFIYPDHRLALINNQYASVGDKIGTYTVINIQRDTVELKDSHDARITLTVVPDIKKAVTSNQG